MSTTIAIVLNITGKAWAEAPDGSRRLLDEGGALMAGERLITADDARVLLDFGYDNTATVDGGITIMATAEMANDFIPARGETGVEDSSIAEALASIEEALGGAIEDAEAPAAGLDGGSSGGSSSVRLARIIESIEPAGLGTELSPYQFNGQFFDDGNGSTGLEDSAPAQESDVISNAPGSLAIDSTSGGTGASTTFIINGSGTNLSPSGSVQVTVTDQAGSSISQVVVIGPDGAFTAVFSQFPGMVDGPVTVEVTGTAANGADLSDTTSGVLDLIAGGVTIAIDSVDNATQTINLSGSTTDVAPGDSVDITISDAIGNEVTTSAIVGNDGTYAVAGTDVSSLVDGTLTVSASATDRNDGSVSGTTNGTLDAVAGDLTVAIDAIDSDARTIDLSGTTADVAPGETVTLSVVDSAGNVVTATSTVTDDGTFSLNDIVLSTAGGIDLVDGSLTVNASADDRNGNNLNATQDNVVLDSLNGDLTVSFTDFGTTTNGEPTINVTGTTSDVAPGNVVTLTITNDANETIATGTGIVGPDGSYTIDGTELPTGLTNGTALNVIAEALDRNGTPVTDTIDQILFDFAGDDVPVITGDVTGDVAEDASATLSTSGDLNAAGGDVGEDQFTAETLTGTYGNLAVNEDGGWTYSADNSQAAIQGLTENDSLTDSFTVTNADGVTTETVTITINGTDDVPTISGDTSGSVTEDAAATRTTTGNLAATGGDADEDQFSAETLTGTYGDLVVGADGGWTYSADNSQAAIQGLTENDSLTDSFTVTNADGVTTETVTITITGTDDAPVISGDTTGSVTEDGAATLTTNGDLNASGGDAGENQFNAETLTGTYGSLVVGQDGSWTYSADNSQAAIQGLTENDSLTDSFIVTNSDGVTTETVTITINGTDDVPVISGDTSSSLTEDDAATLTTAGTLAAANGDAGENEFTAETLTGTYGDLVVAADGGWTYSADNSQSAIQGLTQNDSLTDSFTVTNADGVTTETVTITINGTDDVPEITGDATGSVTEDAGNVLSTNGTLTATNGDAGEDQFVAEILSGTYGELTMGADGSWTYSADNSQAAIQGLTENDSLTDSFTVTNADGVTTETVTITINGTDDVPVISGDTTGSVTEDAAATLTTTGNLAATGGDAGEDQFTAGTLTGTYGDLVVGADGGWTYSADNSQTAIQGLTQTDSLTDSFTVTNADGVTTETVTITINGTDDLPTISGDTTGSVTEDVATTLTTAGTLAAANGDAGEGQFTAETLTGTYGNLVVGADGGWTYSADNSQAAIQGLTENDSLTDSFTVTNADGVTTETVTITINGTDDVPTISGDTSGSVTEDAAATLTTTGNLAATGGDVGEDQFIAETLTGSFGDLVIGADGGWTYSANNSQTAIQGLTENDSLTDSFTVTNADGVTTETVTITINGTNDVPTISGDTTGSVTEDDAGTLTTAGTLAAANGDAGEDQFDTETLTGTYGNLEVNEDGGWTYSADNSQAAIQGLTQNDSLTDSFTVTNADGVTTETVTITINGTDDVPTISGDTTGSVTEDGATTLTTAGTLAAANGDAGEDQFTAETLTGTYGNLVVGADGGWTYSADNSQAAIQGLTENDSLTDSFTVTNADGVTTDTVTITINGNDDVPTISGDTSSSVTEDDAATLTTAGTLAAANGDAGEDQFTAETLTGTYGNLVVGADGGWTYSADNSQAAIQGLTENDSLTDSFTVTNADGVTTDTVTVTINGNDDVPTISGETSSSVTEDDAATLTTTGNLAATGGDAGENQFNAETLTGTYGNLVVGQDGSWTYSTYNSQAAIQGLTENDSLTDSFTVTNADGVTTETVTITIDGTDDVPEITGDVTGSVTEDAGDALSTNGTLTAANGDAGEDQFVAEILSGTYGELTMGADGSWTYSADNSQTAIQELGAGESLSDSFTVTNADGVTTQEVAITINGTNEAPTAVADNYTNGRIPGLSGEYFAYQQGADGSNLTNLTQVEAFIASTSADATFTGTSINYGSVSGNLGSDQRVQSFLKDDASSLSNDPENSSDAIIKMTGELELAPGTYQFQVRADDGYSIRVNGQVVAEFNGNQGATTRTGSEFTLAGEGPHSLEIVYWDQAGAAQLQVQIRPQGGTYETLSAQHVSHTAVDTDLVVDENQVLEITPDSLLGNDVDANGDSLVIQSVQDAVNGTVSLDTNGNVVFTPDDFYTGEATFSYTVSDGQGGIDTATVTVNVLPAADAPTLTVDDTSAVQAGITTISTGLVDETVDPSAGNSGNGLVQSALERELGVESGFLDGRFDPTGPTATDPGTVNVIDGKITEVTQALNAGMEISWGYTFVNGEDSQAEVESGFNDVVALIVTTPTGVQETLLVDSSETKYSTQVANGSFSYTASESGNYQFQWLVLNGGDSAKDSSLELSAPTLTVPGLTGSFGTPVALDINAALSDQDGSETLDIVINGVPDDAALTAGSKNADGTWSLTNGDLDGLQLLAATEFSGDIALSVTATATETATGDQQSVTESLTVTVDQTDETVSGTGLADDLQGGETDDLMRGYDGNDTLGGNEGNDYLLGGAGNDLLVGGADGDVLTGGVGADVFQWDLGDEGSGSTTSDVITDFTIDTQDGYTGSGEGDQLELSDLLQDASASTINDFMMAKEEDGDTVLYLNKDGALNESSDNAQQAITLSGITMDGQSSEQFIDALLNNGHIKIE